MLELVHANGYDIILKLHSADNSLIWYTFFFEILNGILAQESLVKKKNKNKKKNKKLCIPIHESHTKEFTIFSRVIYPLAEII